MSSQVLNFLWLGLDCPAQKDPRGGIRNPIPDAYIAALRAAARRHLKADVVLWVDSVRLTDRQMRYLKIVTEAGLKNVTVKDLRTIQRYTERPLFQASETSLQWRTDKHSLIWRQVDAAKILISLQGNYDQTFFADFDLAHVNIDSGPVQKRLKAHGLIIGLSSRAGMIENQIWGFQKRRKGFFENYFCEAMADAAFGNNGWNSWHRCIPRLLKTENIGSEDDIGLSFSQCNTPATHPGHAYGTGRGEKQKAEIISSAALKVIFNRAHRPRCDKKPPAPAHVTVSR